MPRLILPMHMNQCPTPSHISWHVTVDGWLFLEELAMVGNGWPTTSSPPPSTLTINHCILDFVWHEMDEELYLSVPSKRNGLWGTIVRRERRVRRGMWRVFKPSINTPPPLIGVSRNRQLKMLDFPAPVRPAIPTYCPKKSYQKACLC